MGAWDDWLFEWDEAGLRLDLSRAGLPAGYFRSMETRFEAAYRSMEALEAGAVANPDEGRQVGHYWLRAPELAPTREIRQTVEQTLGRIERFAAEVHAGRVRPEHGGRFTDVLLIGIGGSALGPQFVADALGDPDADRLTVHFLDNTDPDGFDRVLRTLRGRLDTTLCLVVSKTGRTRETLNGLRVVSHAYAEAGLHLAAHAVAVTGISSSLDQQAAEEGWLARFPMWEWVGGRTSETGPVGLLPAALQGVDIRSLLEGAALCDAITRSHGTDENPAALLASCWYHATDGRGTKDMVVLPYKDRLSLFSRYLQQLVMESLGKGHDLDGRRVEQGLTVYGNKGSTDQHAYIQQLREGVPNFFATFIGVLEDGGEPVEVEPGVTAGDYLHGFLLGTREALWEAGRPSISMTLRRVDAFHVGVLIALFERTVGYYARLIHVNAYHQPGVEAGKKAAAAVVERQKEVVARLAEADRPMTAEEVATAVGAPESTATVCSLLDHLSANGRGVEVATDGTPAVRTYRAASPTARST